MFRQDTFKTVGMAQDTAFSNPTERMAYENMNLRITTTDNNTLLCWTNEKGTKEITNYVDMDGNQYNYLFDVYFKNKGPGGIYGRRLSPTGRHGDQTPIGQAIIGDYYIIFTTTLHTPGPVGTTTFCRDAIYRINFTEDNGITTGHVLELYRGNLGFDANHPIETLPFYENQEIQKVYWIDGLNVFRCIEVYHDNLPYDNSFKFTINEDIINIEDVEVTRNTSSGVGLFPSGTIQYCFTCLNYYGVESNISYITPIYYISNENNRGGNPEENNTISFALNINITNENKNKWKFLRVYSIVKTSLSGTPIVKCINDISIADTNTYKIIDDNANDEIISTTDLLFKGGRNIIPNAISQSFNTLFLGNFSVKTNALESYEGITKDSFRELSIIWNTEDRTLEKPSNIFPYKYSLDSNSFKTTHFKYGEWYRFGLVLQYTSGETSEVIYIGDSQCPSIITGSYNSAIYSVPVPNIVIPDSFVSFFKYNNIKKIIPVIVYTDYNDCSVLAQGVCNPTVYNVEDRFSENKQGSPFSYPSWFYRPYPPEEVDRRTNSIHSTIYHYNYDTEGYFGRSPHWDFDNSFNIIQNTTSDKKHNILLNTDDTFYDDFGIESKKGVVENDGVIPINVESMKYTGNTVNYSFIDYKDFFSDLANYTYPVSTYAYKQGNEDAALSKLPVGIMHYKGFINYDSSIPRMGAWAEFRHDLPIPSSSERNGEIQSNYMFDYNYSPSISAYSICTPYYKIDPNFKHGQKSVDYTTDFNLTYSSEEEYLELHKNHFFIDYNHVTMHSPEFEYEDYFQTTDVGKFKLRVAGIVPISSNVTNYDLQTSEGPLPVSHLEKMQKGLTHETIGEKIVDFTNGSHVGISRFGYRGLISAPIWEDDIDGRDANRLTNSSSGEGKYLESFGLKTRYVVYPWHSNYLNNGKSKGLLNTKLFCNNRYSYTNIYVYDNHDISHDDIIVTNGINKLYKFKNYVGKEQNYYGTDIDKVVVPYFNNNYILGLNSKYGYPIIISGQSSLNDSDRPTTVIKAGNATTRVAIGRFLDYSKVDEDTENSKTHKVPLFNTAYNGDLFSGKYHRLCDTCWLNPGKTEEFTSNGLDPDETIDMRSLNIGGNYMYQYLRTYETPYTRFYASTYFNKQVITGSKFRWLFGYTKLKADVDGLDDDTGTIDVVNMTNTHSIQPCQIRYKSNSHALISLGIVKKDPINTYLNLLPKLKNYNNTGLPLEEYSLFNLPLGCQYFWIDRNESNCAGAIQYYIRNEGSVNPTDITCPLGYLVLAELYRDVDPLIRFGGSTEEAISNNRWIIAGDSVEIKNDSSLNITWQQGDFYYQRYNNILTYPFSNNDKNSVLDTLSFMVETRINLDGGRYSKTKVPITSYLNFENLNQLNKAYSQKNDYFTYYALDKNKINLEEFKNTVTWTLPKIAGSLVDNWLNVTVANTLDLNASYGKINALRNYSESLFAFQDNAISIINFNTRVQIQPSDGVPIEIANGGKVDGYTLYSDKYGCQNKWSICTGSLGMYFIDNISKDIYVFTPKEGIQPLASSKSMRSFILNNNTLDTWNSINMNNFVTYYDNEQKDIYFINKDYALAFNEGTGSFTSFYSYNNSPYFATINNFNIWINGIKLWEHRKGEYNSFFGIDREFYTEVVAGGFNSENSASRLTDKIFNNIEFRSDSFNGDEYISDVTFDTLKVENEYQENEISLINIKDRPTNLKKKFRIWHANIPRDRKFNRDRIRNPWAKIKLSKKEGLDKHLKTNLHDLIVYYYD